jgi:thermitase
MVMKIIKMLPIIVVLLVLLYPSNALAAQNSGGSSASFVPDEIMVKFKPGTTLSEIAKIHRQFGGRVNGTIASIGVQVVSIAAGTVPDKVRAYSAQRQVAYAEPDYLAEAINVPDDSDFGMQWDLNKIEAPQAWDVTTGSSDVHIAILDTGVDLDHADLANKIISSINFSGSTTVDDVYGHGTHVAGIAAAVTNNGTGVAGLGYNSTIMNVKVLGDSGSGYYSWIASGITWAADNGAQVINMSLGGPSSSLTLEEAINYAWSKGVVVVAAAGNSGMSSPFYPAYCNNCIAVAATDVNDALPSWSNYGDWVDVAAPGVSIYSTLKDGNYGYKSGTSMASPHATGLAALLFTTVSDSNGNSRLNDEVRQRMEATCDNIGLTGIGSGRINAAKAVGTTAVAPGAITGQVKDTKDGSPISGAGISDGTRSTVSNATGNYVIDSVPPGTYQITVNKSGYETSFQTISVASATTTIANFSLNQIIVPGSIAGSVTNAKDGLPIAGALVNDGTRTATTDASGNYIIADVPPGNYQVTASKDGYESLTSSVTVISAATSVVNYSLSSKVPVNNTMWVDNIRFIKNGKNLFIEVRVVTAGGVLPGVKVGLRLECSNERVWNFSGTTSSAGTASFKVGKAPSGDYHAIVNSLTYTGFTWDTTRGITSADYTP